MDKFLKCLLASMSEGAGLVLTAASSDGNYSGKRNTTHITKFMLLDDINMPLASFCIKEIISVIIGDEPNPFKSDLTDIDNMEKGTSRDSFISIDDEDDDSEKKILNNGQNATLFLMLITV